MSPELKQKMAASVKDYYLPRYDDLPDVGLYLDQVVKYVNRYLSICPGNELTPSMVSNYVKQKIIPGPVRKSYGPDTLEYLIFVAFMKMVIPMDVISYMISVQKSTYDLKVAYDYFCAEFENMLQVTFGLKEEPDEVGHDDTDQKQLLKSAVQSIVHKIYLVNYIGVLKENS